MTKRPTRSAKRPSSLVLYAGILFLTVACSAERETVRLQFGAVWQGATIDCNDGDISLTDLRFFVSDLALVDKLGELHPIALLEDDRWQQSNIALVDLEDGQGRCLNGTSDRHATLTGTADRADFVELRFTVGDAAMHWHWRSGYKFLRAGVSAGDDSTWIHLGSSGCKGTVQNIESCRSPNRVKVSLPVVSTTSRIGVDLSVLFSGVDLANGEPSDCSSGPAETDCAPMFEALGLPFGEHAALDSSVFTVLP